MRKAGIISLKIIIPSISDVMCTSEALPPPWLAISSLQGGNVTYAKRYSSTTVAGYRTSSTTVVSGFRPNITPSTIVAGYHTKSTGDYRGGWVPGSTHRRGRLAYNQFLRGNTADFW